MSLNNIILLRIMAKNTLRFQIWITLYFH